VLVRVLLPTRLARPSYFIVYLKMWQYVSVCVCICGMSVSDVFEQGSTHSERSHGDWFDVSFPQTLTHVSVCMRARLYVFECYVFAPALCGTNPSAIACVDGPTRVEAYMCCVVVSCCACV
jgi:hypothetical protein